LKQYLRDLFFSMQAMLLINGIKYDGVKGQT